MTKIVDDRHWFLKQITVGNLVSVATIIAGFASFYYSTTNAIDTQAKEIGNINRKLDTAERKDDREKQSAILERNALRAEMTQRSEKTSEILSEVKQQQAVLNTQLTTISSKIVELGTKVDTLTTFKR